SARDALLSDLLGGQARLALLPPRLPRLHATGAIRRAVARIHAVAVDRLPADGGERARRLVAGPEPGGIDAPQHLGHHPALRGRLVGKKAAQSGDDAAEAPGGWILAREESRKRLAPSGVPGDARFARRLGDHTGGESPRHERLRGVV